MSTTPLHDALWRTAFSVALLGCSGECPTLRACDVRDESCQDRTAEVAACLRGSDPIDVTVEVVGSNDYIDRRVRAFADGQSEADRDLRRALALLQLMPSEPDLAASVRARYENISASFSGETETITIVHDGGRLDESWHVTRLLHEIVHAMQFAERDDSELESPTFDHGLALTAMTEGEATLYGDIARLEGYSISPKRFDWDGSFDHFKRRTWSLARTTPEPYARAGSHFAYSFGGAYLNRAWQSGGRDAVRRHLGSPPTSTREILAGLGATPPDDVWSENPEEVGVPVTPSGLERVGVTYLGVWLFEVFLDHLRDRVRSLDERTDSGFRGDVLTAFRATDGDDLVVTWRLRFDRAEQARALRRDLDDTGVVARDEDRDVYLVVSTDETLPDRLVDGLDWGPSPAPEDASDEMTPSFVECPLASGAL